MRCPRGLVLSATDTEAATLCDSHRSTDTATSSWRYRNGDAAKKIEFTLATSQSAKLRRHLRAQIRPGHFLCFSLITSSKLAGGGGGGGGRGGSPPRLGKLGAFSQLARACPSARAILPFFLKQKGAACQPKPRGSHPQNLSSLAGRRARNKSFRVLLKPALRP